ncbi:hypothetical protein, partial [Frankia sp. CiP1_Cm_nod2]|uniref:hypothetical protein n=1 Tax=Frankia sp. CiP1_Cm_nod2 TaxID=2897161 RepID=UPI0020257E1D
AARQLRAAIHVLGRLADTWDVQHHYLETDNVDLEVTLASLARLAGVRRTRQPRRPQPAPGVTDRGLNDLIARNDALQRELELLQNRHRENRHRENRHRENRHRESRHHAAGREDEEFGRVLLELHQRRTNRAAAAAGVAHDR